MLYADGDTYKGKWKENKANGIGSYTEADGTNYHGEWQGIYVFLKWVVCLIHFDANTFGFLTFERRQEARQRKACVGGWKEIQWRMEG